MELQAVIAALEALPEKNMQVDIYTDSKYVVNSVEKGWLKNWVAKHFRKVKKCGPLEELHSSSREAAATLSVAAWA